MRSFGPRQLPSINALAGAFRVCDHWFSEVPGPTQPNRLYMHAATSSGLNYNNWSQKFDCKTIYNSLQDAGLTWAVYWTDDNEVAEFTQVASEASRFKDYATSFRADAEAGQLPNYVFIEPQFNSTHDTPANSQHPPTDARHGDHLVADVYEAVRGNEAAWAKTLLVVTYDEHGGFYDHVVPPARDVPNPDGLDSPPAGAPGWVLPFVFDRLGIRVPALLVSPWIDRGVESRPLQHTSVLATLKELFGLPSFLTRRDASAASFADLVGTRSAPRTDTPRRLPRARLPATSTDPEDPANPGNAKLDATQQEIVQGAHALTAAACSAAEPVATTQHEASHQMKRRINAYLRYQAQMEAADR
jgi:phospholipase C